MSFLSSFLKIGLMIACFKMSGNVLVSKEILIIFVIYGVIIGFKLLIIFDGMLSMPVATLDFIVSIIFSILRSVSFSKLKGEKSKTLSFWKLKSMSNSC